MNSLYEQLSTHTPLIVPDRGLSTYGIRTLKSLRVQKSGWPLSGVYSPKQLAEKFLKEQGLLKKTPSDLELFAHLHTQRPEISLSELYKDFLKTQKLQKYLPKLWAAKILSQKESKETLSAKSFDLLYNVLLIENYASKKGLCAHAFEALAVASNLLLKDKSKKEWRFHSLHKTEELFILGFRELYPLESLFLESTGLEIKFQKESLSWEEKSGATKMEEFPSKALEQNFHLLWTSNLDMPGPLEAQLLTSSLEAIKMSIPAELRDFSPLINKIKEDWLKLNPKELLSYCAQKSASTEGHQELENLLTNILKDKDPQQVDLLLALGFFDVPSVSRPLNVNEKPKGPTLFSLEDIPLCQPTQTLLWAHTSKDVLETVSGFLRGESFFLELKDLEKALLAEGLALPQEDKEQEVFEHFFHAWSKDFHLLEALPSPYFETSHVPYKKTHLPQKRELSPSGLEKLFKCSLSFHYSNELRLSSYNSPDDLAGSPIQRGNWVHNTLEKCNWEEVEKINAKSLLNTLKNEIETVFKEDFSQDYKKTLLAQAPSMALALEYYIQKIELPLKKLFPHRSIETEKNISTSWTSSSKEALKLRGRVDRLDFLGTGYLLWDYKSGDFSKNNFLSGVENGRFQWLLYKEIFDKEQMPIFGGGYINPLNLKKSRLIFFEEAPFPEEFYDHLKQMGVFVERLNKASEKEVKEKLVLLVNSLVEKYLTGLRVADVSQPRHCDYCDFHAFCGHPYLLQPQGKESL